MSPIRVADTAVLDVQDPPQGARPADTVPVVECPAEWRCLWRQLSCSRRVQLPPLRERSS